MIPRTAAQTLHRLAKGFPILAITGPRQSGKTTLAKKYGELHPGLPVYHSDDWQHLEWSKASDALCHMLETLSGRWCYEGVRMVHALRKWLSKNAEGRPCDQVICMWRPFKDLTPGRASLGKACRTVFDEIRPELVRRGVKIQEPEAK
jgi:hypothetical protein